VVTYQAVEDMEDEIVLINANRLRDMWGPHVNIGCANTHCGEDEECYDTSQGSYPKEEQCD
jgi:hypothetical protein